MRAEPIRRISLSYTTHGVDVGQHARARPRVVRGVLGKRRSFFFWTTFQKLTVPDVFPTLETFRFQKNGPKSMKTNTKSQAFTPARGTKGPKIRFPLGTFVEMMDNPGTVYEVIQIYRLKSNPSEWIYRLHSSGRFSQNKHLHKIWYEAVSDHPSGPILGYHRVVNNQEMLRLASVRMDDVFSS